MTMPTLGQLAAMRADVQAVSMPDRAAITDPGTPGTDAGGGGTISGPSTTNDIPCSLTPSGSQSAIREFGEQLTADADWMLGLPAGTAIKTGWTVVVTRDSTRLATGMPAAVSLTIIEVSKPSTLGVRVRALCREGVTIGG
jgi:hypothetical protein